MDWCGADVCADPGRIAKWLNDCGRSFDGAKGESGSGIFIFGEHSDSTGCDVEELHIEYGSDVLYGQFGLGIVVEFSSVCVRLNCNSLLVEILGEKEGLEGIRLVPSDFGVVGVGDSFNSVRVRDGFYGEAS